ncbi:MAG: CDP-alcohol phosphatidyltransferase family protein [Saprospiraceae bacterium]|nr:CDP-alcohol phosphatidyltransferase family protein [Saprospiraceae bacterium]
MFSSHFAIFDAVKRSIPNILTLLNLFLGSSAILLLFSEEILWVLIFAALCYLLDVLDGTLARAMRVSSPLGVQLDSLADLVSFGVLPACVLAYLWSGWCAGAYPLTLMVFVYTVAVGLRLAKFNLDTRDHHHFYGLPSPSGALVLFGLLAMTHLDHPWLRDFQCAHVLFAGLIVLLSTLMLSNLKLWSLKGLGRPRGAVILGGYCIIFAILVLITGMAAFPLMVIVYVLSGLLNLLIKIY